MATSIQQAVQSLEIVKHEESMAGIFDADRGENPGRTAPMIRIRVAAQNKPGGR